MALAAAASVAVAALTWQQAAYLMLLAWTSRATRGNVGMRLVLRLVPKLALACSAQMQLATTGGAASTSRSVLFDSLLLPVPLGWHFPCVALEWLLMSVPSVAAALGGGWRAMQALLLQLALTLAATTAAAVAAEVAGVLMPAAGGPAAGLRRQGSQHSSEPASSKASEVSVVSWASSERSSGAAPGHNPSAASRFLDDLRGSLTSLLPAGDSHAEAMRQAAIAAAARQFGDSVAEAVREGSGSAGGRLKPYVPYAGGICRQVYVGVKVHTPAHVQFDAIAHLLATALEDEAPRQLPAPAVTAACVPGSVQLVGSVTYVAGQEAGSGFGRNGAAAAVSSGAIESAVSAGVARPLARLMQRQREPMPGVSTNSAGSSPERGGAAPSAVLMACQPPCLAEGEPGGLRLILRRPTGAGPAAARLVLFDAAGRLVVDLQGGQLAGGTNVVSLVLPVGLPLGVAHVALLLGDTHLAFVQPLPVLPAAAAEELQQLWALALRESAPTVDSALEVNELPAPASARLRPSDFAAAWRDMAPLLLDVSFLLTGAGGDAGSARAVAAALLPHLAQQGLWALLAHVVAGYETQRAQRGWLRTTAPMLASYVTRPLSFAYHGLIVPAVRGVRRLVAWPRRQAAQRASDCAAKEQPAAASASASASTQGAAAERRGLALLLRGFRRPCMEAHYWQWCACMMRRFDDFSAAYQLLLAIMLALSSCQRWPPQPELLARAAVLAATYVVPAVVALGVRRPAGAQRRWGVWAWSGLYLGCYALAATWLPPPALVLRPFTAEARLRDHCVVVFKFGITDPALRQAGFLQGLAVHGLHMAVASWLCTQNGMPCALAATRHAICWLLGAGVAAASELALRRVFVGSMRAKERGE